ncbi:MULTISPECIES: hypothetical protein [Cryobacterium]|uniref:Uncharacterized protein n=1 Tax=Cryobacterium glucosi TaxID=1259175 RepID=A0ABY2INW9_9MICO|nr:hypothetical protein E3O39_01305 [Cryobacterium sp. MDB2-A-1]TFC05122.1 hypothetical protein E3O59_12950 [Cryobacterium sp. MDB2-33-2]TFC14045.1 hypothetical protein E3O35_03565 [Cryobacterium sp. MDB2-A-2]TFC21394.1 hypothetical protein E3O46_07325 [Cryobacterium glucosi]TFC24096.1 hypothetical protein E3O51_00040 [Cryobacterium sp. MDB2-10]
MSADVMALVMVSQSPNNFSDRDAAEAVIFYLSWRAACGCAFAGTRGRRDHELHASSGVCVNGVKLTRSRRPPNR